VYLRAAAAVPLWDICLFFHMSGTLLLSLTRSYWSIYIYIYIYTHTGFGHRSCDYLPSPLIGTIYVRRGSCISHLTASYRLFACRNFHRCESVSLFQDKTTCCRAFAGTLRTCWFTLILFDAISFGSSTITEESLAFLNKDYRCGTAVRRISSAFSNGDYVFALRGADWHDRKTVSRSVVRESRSRAHKLSPWSVSIANKPISLFDLLTLFLHFLHLKWDRYIFEAEKRESEDAECKKYKQIKQTYYHRRQLLTVSMTMMQCITRINNGLIRRKFVTIEPRIACW